MINEILVVGVKINNSIGQLDPSSYYSNLNTLLFSNYENLITYYGKKKLGKLTKVVKKEAQTKNKNGMSIVRVNAAGFVVSQ